MKIKLDTYWVKWSVIGFIFVPGIIILVTLQEITLVTVGIALLVYNLILASIHDVLNEYDDIRNKKRKRYSVKCCIDFLIVLTNALWKVYLGLFFWSGWNDMLAHRWMSDTTLTITRFGMMSVGTFIFLVVIRVFCGIRKIFMYHIKHTRIEENIYIQYIIMSYEILIIMIMFYIILRNKIFVGLFTGLILIIYEAVRVIIQMFFSKFTIKS